MIHIVVGDRRSPIHQTTIMPITVLCLLLCGVARTLAQDLEWDYSNGPRGPLQWARLFSDECAGFSQSPVAIDRVKARPDPRLTEFVFINYDRHERGLKLANEGGHTAQLELEGLGAAILGGGLKGIFRAAQFHFHWGSTAAQGSEHMLDGRRYPLELHIVHYAARFGTLGRAVAERNGIAVLGFVFELSLEDNRSWDVLVSQLVDIRAAGATTLITRPVSLNSLLPSDLRDYYRYSGGLTTPICSEVVIWTVFRHTIKISARQLEEFRGLRTTSDIRLVDNFRPLQRLNRRVVTVSIPFGRGFSASSTLLQLTLLSSWLSLTLVSGTLYSLFT